MAEKTTTTKKPLSADWFVQGVLTKVGDAFDRLTGRGWKPSSSLATSELAERLKSLVSSEAREDSEGRKFVPHNITLKMQWDKFSTDSTDALKKLEVELLTALVDHINDQRYYTHAPISLEVKPDYFTSGVKLFAGFENAETSDNEASLDVTVPNLGIDLVKDGLDSGPRHKVTVKLEHEIGGKAITKTITLDQGQRLTVGRTKESDLSVDDPSVSKLHASLLLDPEGMLVLSDTGSTNGTFVDGERIAYGKAIKLTPSSDLRFGTVDVSITILERTDSVVPAGSEQYAELGDSEAQQVGDFRFASRRAGSQDDSPAPATEPSIPVPSSELIKNHREGFLSERKAGEAEAELSKD